MSGFTFTGSSIASVPSLRQGANTPGLCAIFVIKKSEIASIVYDATTKKATITPSAGKAFAKIGFIPASAMEEWKMEGDIGYQHFSAGAKFERQGYTHENDLNTVLGFTNCELVAVSEDADCKFKLLNDTCQPMWVDIDFKGGTGKPGEKRGQTWTLKSVALNRPPVEVDGTLAILS